MTMQQSDHLESARVVRDQVPARLSSLQKEYRKCITNLAISPEFRTQTQAFLVLLRSLLDFLTHEVATFCTNIPRKIYFPIATTRMSRTHFEKALSDKWLPGIDVNRRDIFDYLVSLQHFYSGDDWLPAFHALSNENKHVKLSRVELDGFGAVLIRFNGKPVIQIGARGLQSLTIKDGGTLVFKAGPNRATLRGPQTIDQNTKTLLYADPGLDIAQATWTEFKFDEYPHQPAIVFLEIAAKEVIRISRELENLILS